MHSSDFKEIQRYVCLIYVYKLKVLFTLAVFVFCQQKKFKMKQNPLVSGFTILISLYLFTPFDDVTCSTIRKHYIVAKEIDWNYTPFRYQEEREWNLPNTPNNERHGYAQLYITVILFYMYI